ncbi:hypothetical protein [Segatella copri]
MASDISIHVFLLYKDWSFDVCEDKWIAVIDSAVSLPSVAM